MKINITIPVYNEETILEKNVLCLAEFCFKNITDEWFIIISNNGSTDKTAKIAEYLSNKDPKIKHLKLNEKGKGLAIKTAWESYPADFYIFMDADLATDLEALPELVNELKLGNDLVIGSRYLKESRAKRTIGRLLISKIYRAIANAFLKINISDLPCGFKGANQKIMTKILPKVKNLEWAFDTELIFWSIKNNKKIKEMPVKWQEMKAGQKNLTNLAVISWNYFKTLDEIKKRYTIQHRNDI